MFTKLYGYLVAFGALILAILGAIFYGREKGKEADEAKVANVEVKADVAAANTEQVESRDATDTAVNDLPAAPAQTVGTADPTTAAGKLDSGGWTKP
jgi:hypothetical protein